MSATTLHHYSDRIGFVIPAWNAANWIEDTLLSLIRQSVKDWCAVIVDDGSTDTTLHRVNAFLGRRARAYVAAGDIQVIPREHGGLVAAIAHGMKHFAESEHPPLFVGSVASDDHLNDEYVRELHDALIANPDAPCVYPLIREFGARDCWWQPPSWTPRAVINGTTLPGCAVWRRGVWNRLGGYDPQFRSGLEDWDLAARAEAAGFFTVATPPILVPGAVYYHRAHEASLTDTMPDSYRAWAIDLIKSRLAPAPLPPHYPGSPAAVIAGPYPL